ncbi:M48 family metallopeptidase [Exilibacterium tricleocarpae]|uniref:M48 family metallopeptidase n=1 Tax=Exilibacterium tricleocarpae TaxID=2591008 RepID=UPI0015D308EF|nr:M48 family metallopeptidase [Exilibacterium tricleocarpae]
MKIWALLFFLALWLVSGPSGAVPEQIEPSIEVGYRPAIDTDEGGFWYKVDKIEEEVKRSPYLVREAEINLYIKDIVCRLAGEYCGQIRVYIINNPHFNASMYPNGMMHIWTGTLLRVANEAQLAAILGHEIGHYLRSHQIRNWRTARDGMAVAAVLDIGLGALTGVHGLATLGMASGAMAFNREQEREADRYGVQLMVKNGYRPVEASYLWDHVVREREMDESKEKGSLFFATHPQSRERAHALKRLAGVYAAKGGRKYKTHTERFVKRVSPLYFDFMTEHIKLQEYGQTEALLAHHRQVGHSKGMLHFFSGELRRLRKNDGDIDVAIDEYKKAVTHRDAPAVSYRELGYLHLKKKEKQLAKKYFQAYLDKVPAASDHEMITFYIDSIK